MFPGQFYILGIIAATLFLFSKGTLAIRCYVCAPVPEIGETCADSKEITVEDCGPIVEFCHVLFLQQANGATEVTRNCGKYKGAFQAGDNECKDFQLINHASAKLCNCKKDECNLQSFNIPKTGSGTASPTPKGQGGSQSGAGHQVPAINPSQPPAKSAAVSFSGNVFGVLCILWMMGAL